jgi:L-ribulose-5-phosphate 4-epimerase
MGTKKFDNLKQMAFEANISIVKEKLVVLTWGNASSYDESSGIFAIKPSGVAYDSLKWQDMVLVDLDGKVVDSIFKPSSDTLTHLEIYKGFENVSGIVHTHSQWATIWSQAGMSIPCLGTTHADHFFGEIPCLKYLSTKKVKDAYEMNTGKQIVSYFNKKDINPVHMPACLLHGHASFVWGSSSKIALDNAIALESCAFMAYHTLSLNHKTLLPEYVLNKHFNRKHGKDAYYGQNK